MPRTAKSPTRADPQVTNASRAFGARTYAMPTRTKDFLVQTPPDGVQVAFVPTSPAAEERLRAWPPVLAGCVVVSEPADDRGAAAVAQAAFAPGARARALLRGVEIATQDLREAGGAFDAAQVQRLLNGISRQALEKRVKDGSLLAVPGPSNRRRYPALQFDADGVVPGLRAVQAALPSRNPWAVLNFLIRKDPGLGGRAPIALLRAGELDPVVAAARNVGVQGG